MELVGSGGVGVKVAAGIVDEAGEGIGASLRGTLGTEASVAGALGDGSLMDSIFLRASLSKKGASVLLKMKKNCIAC